MLARHVLCLWVSVVVFFFFLFFCFCFYYFFATTSLRDIYINYCYICIVYQLRTLILHVYSQFTVDEYYSTVCNNAIVTLTIPCHLSCNI